MSVSTTPRRSSRSYPRNQPDTEDELAVARIRKIMALCRVKFASAYVLN